MIKPSRMIFFLAVFLSWFTPVFGLGAYSVEVEGSVPASQNNAQQAALVKAREKAVETYIDSRVPPEVKAAHAPRAAEILAGSEQYVKGWEIIEEIESADRVTVRAKVEIDDGRLDAALKKAGLLPVRPLPAVFILVTCVASGRDVPSGWQRSPGAAGTPNACESALAESFERYGMKVIRPGADLPRPDVEMILAPRDELEKKEVMKDLADRYGAGAMVVGKAEVGSGDASGTLLVAVADLGRQQLLWSEKIEDSFPVKGPGDVDPALGALCKKAGGQAVTRIFNAWMPSYEIGEERTVSLIVRGLPGYSEMKDLQAQLEAQAPGATKVTLQKVEPGAVTFLITTSADQWTLVEWLETLGSKEFGLKVATLDEDSIVCDAGPR